MDPKDIIFYLGEYSGSKWEHFYGDKFEELVKLVSISVVTFGFSKDSFMKLLLKEIDSNISYLVASDPESVIKNFGKESMQGDLPF